MLLCFDHENPLFVQDKFVILPTWAKKEKSKKQFPQQYQHWSLGFLFFGFVICYTVYYVFAISVLQYLSDLFLYAYHLCLIRTHLYIFSILFNFQVIFQTFITQSFSTFSNFFFSFALLNFPTFFLLANLFSCFF